VDFAALNDWAGDADVSEANTALHAYEIAGKPLAQQIANRAAVAAKFILKGADIDVDIVLIDRMGNILARSS
jgi:cobalt-precorrin-5B (C1)-methyltransferase